LDSISPVKSIKNKYIPNNRKNKWNYKNLPPHNHCRKSFKFYNSSKYITYIAYFNRRNTYRSSDKNLKKKSIFRAKRQHVIKKTHECNYSSKCKNKDKLVVHFNKKQAENKETQKKYYPHTIWDWLSFFSILFRVV